MFYVFTLWSISILLFNTLHSMKTYDADPVLALTEFYQELNSLDLYVSHNSILQLIRQKASEAVPEAERRIFQMTSHAAPALLAILENDVPQALGLKLKLANGLSYNSDMPIKSTLIYQPDSNQTFTWIPNYVQRNYLVKSWTMFGPFFTISDSLVNLLASTYKTQKTFDASTITPEDKLIIDKTVAVYKIHLMPYKHQIPEILYLLSKEIKNNERLRNSIEGFKFNITWPDLYSKDAANLPTIVIYPILGKSNAQYVLNSIYILFKEFPGLNIKPRWNEKVTDLIYWAQGHGDDKGANLAFLYEPGDDTGNGRVTYRKDISGTDTDYYLKNPAQSQGS